MDQIESNIRGKERSSIEEICNNYHRFKNMDINLRKKLVYIIEASILNASIDKALERGLQIYWNSEKFLEQYSNIGYQVKMNLDVNSSVNLNKSNETRFYLIDNLCDYMLIKYLKFLQTKGHIINISTENLNIIAKYISPVKAEKLGYYTALQLNPFINQAYIDELKIRSQQNIKIKFSTLYKCSKCSKSKTQTKEFQTRCGDEGGTLFIFCLVCGHQWKQY